MRWALPLRPPCSGMAERARRMRDGKSNHEEISPSEKKKGGGIPIQIRSKEKEGEEEKEFQ